MKLWPFCKNEKQDNEGVVDPTLPFKDFRQIGQTFNYLGRECVVTGHSSFIPMIGIVPELHADYVDDAGVIHSISFRLSELPTLIAQNREAP